MFDFFKRKGPSPKQIARAVRRLTESHGEEAPRIEAAQKLVEWGTPESLFGLTKRFTMSSRVITQDVEEKRMVVAMLVDQGEAAVEPLLQYMKTYDQIDWPMQALAQIVDQEDLRSHLQNIIQTVAESEFSPPEHRVSLIRAAHGYVTAEMAPMLEGFLEDADDDVRLAALEALTELGEPVRETLLETFLRNQDRPRIRQRIAEIFAERRWAVKGFRPKIEASLPSGFRLNAKGVVYSL